ncbi:ribose-5-phosphate isomerase A [Pullulanibacillus camelliae]|uniref:Ribose-5-phosphate isomerase A n=1 Tax=Pullulanibacillus camelliae TaxID=1707096 RepID=A0A8J2YL06_9BACL|nr:ribose-5-phosphate isomerase RpiA [Pullulanibacillus camelliae]GGE49818.1 ribose-5-phosphate isomerase A [Pullulanibacillus camelliae]
MKQINEQKQLVGEAAAAYIEDGMMVGLGTGSTVYYTILKLAQRIKAEGLNIQTVSTSKRTTELAKSNGITVLDLNKVEHVDLTIDGCDEFDPLLRGIKGGGGALLFEKIVAAASERNIWVADSSKAVKQLGKFPLPVEVLPFGHTHVLRTFKNEGMEAAIRQAPDGTTYYTDSGNIIIDLYLQEINDPTALSLWLNSIPGVIENGLFINIADKVIFIKDNAVQEMQR